MLTTPSRGKPVRRKHHNFGTHDEYLSRITKSLYYVKLPPVECTSYPVTELAAEIFSETKGKLSLDHLSVEEAASLSHNACVSPCSLVLALLYLDRLKSSNPKYLAKVSPSELFLISLMVGSKFLQDDGEDDEVNNCEWAASAGLTVQDVNRAEKEFLSAIQWEVFVSKEDFWRRLQHLEMRVGLRQGCKRGWFSYSELDALMDLLDFTAIVNSVMTVTTACLTSYAASVLALVGSAMLVSHIPGLSLHPGTAVVRPNGSHPAMAELEVELPLSLPPPALNLTATLEQPHWTAALLTDIQTLRNRFELLVLDNVKQLRPSGESGVSGVVRWQSWTQPLTTWSDVIRNCVLKESAVPTILLPVTSF